MRVEHAHRTFPASRSAQRRILAGYLGIAPSAVQIVRTCQMCGGDHGRPRIAGAGFDYSVSHTPDWVVLAVVGEGLVGVDVESPRRALQNLAPHLLTPAERARFDTAPTERRPDLMIRAWTRKEAASKVTGHGLAAFTKLDVSGPIVAVGPGLRLPMDSDIHLREIEAPGGHVAAVATTPRLVRVVACRDRVGDVGSAVREGDPVDLPRGGPR